MPVYDIKLNQNQTDLGCIEVLISHLFDSILHSEIVELLLKSNKLSGFIIKLSNSVPDQRLFIKTMNTYGVGLEGRKRWCISWNNRRLRNAR